jgi:hypothetical protein
MVPHGTPNLGLSPAPHLIDLIAYLLFPSSVPHRLAIIPHVPPASHWRRARLLWHRTLSVNAMFWVHVHDVFPPLGHRR